MRRRMIIVAAGVVLLGLAGLQVWARTAPDPARGSVSGLPACPDRPNCVRTGPDGPPPLAFEGGPEAAWSRLVAAVGTLPRTTIVTTEPGYLAAECRSLVFGFVDDLEAWRDPDASVIHVRSASRRGHSDGGVNARRIERLRAAFEGRDD